MDNKIELAQAHKALTAFEKSARQSLSALVPMMFDSAFWGVFSDSEDCGPLKLYPSKKEADAYVRKSNGGVFVAKVRLFGVWDNSGNEIDVAPEDEVANG